MSELITTYSERIEEPAESTAQPCDEPLFVTGMFRSGTSLLYALLNQHPQIGLMWESDLACLSPIFWFGRSTTEWLQRWESWNGTISKHKADFSRLQNEAFDFKKAVHAVYVEYARQKKGATVWGCKSPTYCDALMRLHRNFPNARFLVIWRDLRDICRSLLSAAESSPFFNRRDMILRFILGYREMYLQSEALVKSGARIHQLHYEELVRDPGKEMRAICQFLDLPFDPRMTELKGADRTAIDDFSHHAKVKSEEIAAREGAFELPPGLAHKLDRYIHLWHKQTHGAWPTYPPSLPGQVGEPSRWELLRDRVGYRAVCSLRDAAPAVFSVVPTRWWETYRRIIGGRRLRRVRNFSALELKNLDS